MDDGLTPRPPPLIVAAAHADVVDRALGWLEPLELEIPPWRSSFIFAPGGLLDVVASGYTRHRVESFCDAFRRLWLRGPNGPGWFEVEHGMPEFGSEGALRALDTFVHALFAQSVPSANDSATSSLLRELCGSWEEGTGGVVLHGFAPDSKLALIERIADGLGSVCLRDDGEIRVSLLRNAVTFTATEETEAGPSDYSAEGAAVASYLSALYPIEQVRPASRTMANVVYGDHTLPIYNPYQGQLAPEVLSVTVALDSGRFYEEDFLEYIRLLRLTGTYLDVGAYIGTHSLFFSVFCEADRVIAVEPMQDAARAIRRNARINGISESIEVLPVAASNARRCLWAPVFGETVRFECDSLDVLIEEPISLMKIDVEGMELEVLEGATGLLSLYHPVVFVEAHTADRLQAIARYLEPIGYERSDYVFNATPTYEFVVPGTSPRLARLDLLTTYEDFVGAVRAKGDAGLEVESQGDDAYVVMGDQSMASGVGAIDIAAQGTALLELAIERDDSIWRVDVTVVGYEADGSVASKTVFRAARRNFFRVELAYGVTRIRVALRFAGHGRARIIRFGVLGPNVDQ